MPYLERKIYTIKIPFFKDITGRAREILDILAKENVAIKGGLAKIILGEILKSEGKIEQNLALGYKSGTDVDLLATFSGSRKEGISIIADKIKNLKEKFLKLNANLDEKDVEIMKGDLNDIKFIKNFLGNRDLTINEVVFIPKSETLFFTDKCLRDTVNAVGILSANKVGTLRRDCGRIIASSHGMVRLIRFLTEKKVNYIYLPSWWISLNKQESERLGQSIFGAFGLILIRRYENNEALQLRFMKILNDLAITNIKHFDTFKKEQEILFEISREKEFEFKERSFREIQKGMLIEEQKRQNTRIEAKKKKAMCPHKNKIEFTCDACSKLCIIKKCRDCEWYEIVPKGQSVPFSTADNLFCNRSFIRADVYWDKNGFFPDFPKIQEE